MDIIVSEIDNDEELISNEHTITFAYTQIDNAIEMVKEYTTFLKAYLNNNNSLANIFLYLYNKYVSHKNDEIYTDLNSAVNVVSTDFKLLLDIPIVYNCNFSCAYCQMAAPMIQHNTFIDPEELKYTLLKLKSLYIPSNICLFGGEPLLHPELCKIFIQTRNIFSDTNISIVTNGFLLPTLNKVIKSLLRFYKINLEISIYGPGVYFYNEPFFHLPSTPIICKTCENNLYNVQILKTKSGYYILKPNTILHANGDIQYCHMSKTNYVLSKIAKTIPNNLVYGSDIINIHTLTNYDQLKKFWSTGTCAFSKHCNMKTSIIPWTLSTRKLEEFVIM